MESENQKPKYKRSCAIDRAIMAYPSPKIIRQIEAYTKRTQKSKSSLISKALEEYFLRYPERVSA